MYLVIGAGPAGLGAIETIREFGDETPIALVCDEAPYSRMVLPYLMDGTIVEKQVFTSDEKRLNELGVTPHLGRRVVSIDPAGKAVLDDGTELGFTKALIATGSSATRPPIPGVDGPGVFNLWNLDDAKAVMDRRGSHVAVVGAGFIAFTCLDAILDVAGSVTVIEVEDRILPRMVDAPAAQLVQDYLSAQGVGFRTGGRVVGVEDVGPKKRLALEGSDPVEADVVIIATGIRPNLELLEGSGIKVDQGIIVDEHMRTSAPNVYAAGDIAQGPVVGSDTKQVHAIQPTATDHGRIAGANMAGHDASYWGSVLMNIVAVRGLQIASFGDWAGDDVKVVSNPSGPVYRKLVFDRDKLSGAIFLGRPDDVAMLNDMGMVKGMIQTQADLGPWREYLDRNPLDVRRPYVASGAADELLRQRLIGRPSSGEGYRVPDPPPTYWPHHETFVSTIPSE